MRPDSRLSINQTMLAIYEANPQAFDGNINVMRAGASLRIPSADDVFRIGRGDALVEVQRQNSAWTGEPSLAPVDTQPSLTLVPPDEEDDIGLIDDTLDIGVDDAIDDTIIEDIDPVDARINEIQAILDDQDALLEIPDNELAALRAELATLRGEELPADPVDDVFVDDVEDLPVDDAADDIVEDAVDTSPPAVVTPPVQDEGIVATIMGYLQNFWVWVGGALLVTVAILFWFMRRAANRDDEEVTGVWEALDSDDFDAESTSTEQLSALSREDDESIVVVETQQTATLADDDFLSDTFDAPEGFEPDRTLETPAPVCPRWMPGLKRASTNPSKIPLVVRRPSTWISLIQSPRLISIWRMVSTIRLPTSSTARCLPIRKTKACSRNCAKSISFGAIATDLLTLRVACARSPERVQTRIGTRS